MKPAYPITSLRIAQDTIKDFLSILQSEADELKDLLNSFSIRGENIIVLGCDIGIEAYALFWIMNATKVVGLDLENKIFSANEFKETLNQAVEYIKYNRQFKRVPNGFNEWWEKGVPDFIKEQIFPQFMFYEFGDDGGRCEIDDNSIEIAYCSSVLYWIRDKKGDIGLKLTLQEIKKMLGNNNYFVAREPGDEDYETLLNQYFLVEHKYNTPSIGPGLNTYICKNIVINPT